MADSPSTDVTWPEAMATVTACHYTAGAGRALAFGLPTARHFRITFNYFVDGEIHTGEFSTGKAMAQGTLFPVTYNPASPGENDRSGNLPGSIPPSRAPVLVVGVIGSIILSLAWLAVLRGCH